MIYPIKPRHRRRDLSIRHRGMRRDRDDRMKPRLTIGQLVAEQLDDDYLDDNLELETERSNKGPSAPLGRVRRRSWQLAAA